MRKLVAALTLVSFVAVNPLGGTIEGIVTAKGKEIPTSAGGGAYESRKFKFVEKVDYSRLRDFVVYLEGPFEGAVSTPPAKPLQVVTQKDAVFRPHVLPILKGTSVEWPNQDDILHNVFSDSEPARFDLGLYKNEKKAAVVFDKAGRVDVFCSIHTKMHCIVLVLDSPYFAATDDKNHFVIRNVPPGKYAMRTWHERMPSQVQEVVVPDKPDSVVKANVLMQIKVPPSP
jgi:plastocyanin